MNEHGLQVQVTADLVLDAGSWYVEGTGDDARRIITSPATPLIEQIIAFLERIPDPGDKRSMNKGAVALGALALRWGSYYAVLADATRPLWPHARDETVSAISDAEMRRINIEASFALSRMLEIYRHDAVRFWSLLRRAHAALPMPRATAKRNKDSALDRWLAMVSPEAQALIREKVEPARLKELEDEVAGPAGRVIANALINGTWRNGPVEDAHAGHVRGIVRPIEQCRIGKTTDRKLMAS